MKMHDIFKCAVCGNVVECETNTNADNLICCDKIMEHLIPKSNDASYEKHLPVVEKQGNGYLIKVGSVLHPMSPEHYIDWIDLITQSNKVYRQYLNPNNIPEVFFDNILDEHFLVREHCNLHGIWQIKF
jgi:superoxide reductase